MTAEDWKLVATVVLSTIPSGITVTALLKWNKQVHETAEAIETARKLGLILKDIVEAIEAGKRVSLLVEGNPKEHTEQKKRDGLLGRVKDIEHRELSTKNAQLLQDGTIEEVWKRVRAILRGLGVPSDISDNVRVEREVHNRVSETSVKVDKLAAKLVMAEQGVAQSAAAPRDRPRHVSPGNNAAYLPEKMTPSAERVPRPPHSSDYHIIDRRKGEDDE
jgi:hypothetical protein